MQGCALTRYCYNQAAHSAASFFKVMIDWNATAKICLLGGQIYSRRVIGLLWAAAESRTAFLKRSAWGL